MKTSEKRKWHKPKVGVVTAEQLMHIVPAASCSQYYGGNGVLSFKPNFPFFKI